MLTRGQLKTTSPKGERGAGETTKLESASDARGFRQVVR
jgi:hypothetical protein